MTKLVSASPSPDLTSFAALLGDSFAKRIHLLTQILQGSHYPSVGRYKEKLLARLIAEYIPKNYEVGTGFVLFVHEATKERAQKPGFDPLNMGSHALSKQCDIIVYDSSTVPVVFRDDDFVVVRPEAVRAVIEVKGTISRKETNRLLDACLDFGRKWRSCQLFYLEHHQPLAGSPALYAMCWDIGRDKLGRALTNATKLREQITSFYKESLRLSELKGFPRLNSLFVYNDCTVSEVGWFADESDEGNTDLYEGYMARSGQFTRYDAQNKPYRQGDATIATLLAGLHYCVGGTFNRFYSYLEETREDVLPYEHSGLSAWLTDQQYIRDANSAFVDDST